MLQRLLTASSQQQQQLHQHVLLPLLQQFQSQHAFVLPQQQQQSVAGNPPSSSSSSSSVSSLASTSSSSWLASLTQATSSAWLHHQQQQLAHYSTRNTKLNPKERKAQQKTDKKALKKSAVPQGTASAGDSATSFEDDMQAVEADITRLVLQAIHNITPVLDVRTVRLATTVKYVPGLMPPRKARSLALHWLVRATDARKKNSSASYAECLALELLLAYQKRGGARQKRDDLHKLALQNRANVHMRWW